MAEPMQSHRVPRMQSIDPNGNHTFWPPKKCINDGDDLNFFLSSSAYKDLTTWLSQLNRSMFPSVVDGEAKTWSLQTPLELSTAIKDLQDLITKISSLTDEAPPNPGPRRFGNVAFRTWYQIVEDAIPHLLNGYIDQHVASFKDQNNDLLAELQPYLLGSLGSAQRLDYGTGHELSFLAFLGCLMKLRTFKEGEERAIVVAVIQPYLVLIRKVIMIYTLEPAGSHGVWGLDDHSFAPYIFGSAQFGPVIRDLSFDNTPMEGSVPRSPSPSSVTNKPTVLDYKDSNMYFSAIHFIYEVKKGPFWEHSPILYDISGIKDGWGKINKGMLKMYAAEVLGKFPVVQHFPFGSLFKWETDPEAIARGVSVHAQQQPRSKDTMAPPPTAPTSGSGTQAPWARADSNASGSSTQAPWQRSPQSSISQMQASSGIPTTRAPWPPGPPPRQINLGNLNQGARGGPPRNLPVQPRFPDR